VFLEGGLSWRSLAGSSILHASTSSDNGTWSCKTFCNARAFLYGLRWRRRRRQRAQDGGGQGPTDETNALCAIRFFFSCQCVGHMSKYRFFFGNAKSGNGLGIHIRAKS